MPWLTARLVMIGVAILAVLALLSIGPAACTSLFTALLAERTAKGQAEAAIEAGAEAMNTVSNLMAADEAIEATVKEGRDEILAQPAGRSNDAAVRAACSMRSHVDSERCAALRGAGPGQPAAARPVGSRP